MTETNKDVATIILQQLGGRKFFFMVGGEVWNYTDSSVEINFKMYKEANRMVIEYDAALDLYNVEFRKVVKPRMSKKTFEFTEGKNVLAHEYTGVYGDQLQELFRNVTGLETRMPRFV